MAIDRIIAALVEALTEEHIITKTTDGEIVILTPVAFGVVRTTFGLGSINLDDTPPDLVAAAIEDTLGSPFMPLAQA